MTWEHVDGIVLGQIAPPPPLRCALPEVSPKDVTELLAQWQGGNQEAIQSLLPLIYHELRRLARRHLSGERLEHTLQSTALVHEAYLRMVKPGAVRVENRAHFFAIASEIMRQILVDYARRRLAGKRDGGRRLSLEEAGELAQRKGIDLIALDDALKSLSQMSPRQGRIVELRFFGGLSTQEISAVLGISTATVDREWATAKAWLYREMRGSSPR